MNLNKKLFLFCVSFLICSASYAQIEVARLQTKGFSATGFGAFLNFAVPVNETSAIIAEGGFYYFTNNGNNVAIAPVLAGYRQLLGDTDYGWYVEPVAGYTFGGTDIQKSDSNGNPLNDINGNPIDQKVAGPVAGVGFGYLFQQSGIIQFNISLRVEHTFVTGGDPSLNILALRISHSFSFGRRE